MAAAMDPAVLQFLLSSRLKQLSSCRLPPQLALCMYRAAAVAAAALDAAGLPVLALQAHLLASSMQPHQQDSSTVQQQSQAAGSHAAASSLEAGVASQRLAAALHQMHASQLAAKSLLHLLPSPAAVLDGRAQLAPQWAQQARHQLQLLAEHLQPPS